MNQFITRLAFLFFLSVLILSQPAAAKLSALISVHEGRADMWEQRTRIQELLRQRFAFDEVRFLVDATPEEIPGRMKRFLEDPATADDRRLVWISGFGQQKSESVCAKQKFSPIHPQASSLVLAPRCFTDIVSMPQGTRHFSVTSPTPTTSEARIGRTRSSHAPWIAVLTLPSANEAFIQGTNELVLAHLTTAPKNHLDPAALLYQLRVGFRWNGSDYTPTLDLFDRGVPRQKIRPFGIVQGKAIRQSVLAGSPGRLRTATATLFSEPDAHDGLEIPTRTSNRLRILRYDQDQLMRYVSVGNSFFGWVRSDDLAN